MKKCRVLHINDGNSEELTNGNRFFAEYYPKIEDIMNKLLLMHYEVKQILPEYSPAIQGQPGSYMFYHTGYTFYLEKEINENDNDDEEFKKIFDELNQEDKFNESDNDDDDEIDVERLLEELDLTDEFDGEFDKLLGEADL